MMIENTEQAIFLLNKERAARAEVEKDYNQLKNVFSAALGERDEVIQTYHKALMGILDYQVDVTADADDEIGEMRRIAQQAIEIYQTVESAREAIREVANKKNV